MLEQFAHGHAADLAGATGVRTGVIDDPCVLVIAAGNLAGADINHGVIRHALVGLAVKEKVAGPRPPHVARNEVRVQHPESFGIRELSEGAVRGIVAAEITGTDAE